MVADGGEQPGGTVAHDKSAARHGQQGDGDDGSREHRQQGGRPCRRPGGPQVAVRSDEHGREAARSGRADQDEPREERVPLR